MKRAAEIDKATSLVSQYMAWYHPVLECKSLQDAAAWYLKCDAVTCLQESFLGCWEVSLSLEIHSDAQASKVPLCPPPPSGSAFVSDDTKFQHLTLLRIDLNVPNVSRPKLVPLKQATGAKRERERERERNRRRKILLQWPVHSLMQPSSLSGMMNTQARNALIMEKFPCCNKIEERSLFSLAQLASNMS